MKALSTPEAFSRSAWPLAEATRASMQTIGGPRPRRRHRQRPDYESCIYARRQEIIPRSSQYWRPRSVLVDGVEVELIDIQAKPEDVDLDAYRS